MPPWSTQLIAASAAAAALLAAAWWPLSYREAITRGIDAFEYHAPLFGRHTQSQDIVADQSIEVIGALIVPLRRTAPVPDVEMTLTDPASGQVLQHHTIPGAALSDDAFTYVHLDPPIEQAGSLRVVLSAPAATAENAVGVRFHPRNVYPAGERLFDGQTRDGDLALSWQRRLPLWHIIQKSAQQHPEQARVLGQAALVSALAVLLANAPLWIRLPAARRQWIEIGLLALLALATIGSRLPALTIMGGVSGGDPYNYLFITDRISKGENPLNDKRLPGYPLLLLPAYMTDLDDQQWMRLVNIISAGGTVFMTGLLARALGLPWSIQLCAALLLAWQKDFYWTSLRPEAYTPYAFLLISALVLFFSLTTWPRRLLFGFLLGYAAMTRQEGFVLAAVLGVAAALHLLVTHVRTDAHAPSRSRELLTSYLAAFLPALLVVAPFFLNNAIAYGNPFYTPYFEGERLTIVDSWPAFVDAVGATWGVLGSLWKTNWDQLERVPLTTPLFLLSVLGSALW